MTAVQKRTFVLPSEEASYIDSLVAGGTYANDSEVVTAGLHALQDRDDGIERWLREEVVPVYDAMKADPSRGLTVEEVDAAIEKRHSERTRTAR